MKRREALKNSLMALAISLVPKILQPTIVVPQKVFSLDYLTSIVDEYQLTYLKMQQLVRRLNDSGEFIWWETDSYKQLDKQKSLLIKEIREYFS